MAEGSSGHHPGGNRRPHRTGHHQLHNLSFQPMIEESFPLFTADEEVASERELLKRRRGRTVHAGGEIYHHPLLRHPREPGLHRRGPVALPPPAQVPHHRVSFLHPPLGHHHPAPQAEGSGRALPPLEPLLHRHLL